MSAGMPAPGKSAAVLGVSIVICCADVTTAIPRFIGLEVRKRLGSTRRQRSSVPVVRVIAIVYVAVEAVRSMEPRPGADKHAIQKPVRSVVAIRRTIVRRVIEIAVRANRCRTKVYSHADLRRCMGGQTAKEAEKCQQAERTDDSHNSPRVKLIPEMNRCRKSLERPLPAWEFRVKKALNL
jgi:hypothetical protein